MYFNTGCEYVLEEHSQWADSKLSLKNDNILCEFSLLIGYLGHCSSEIYALPMSEFIQLKEKCFRMQRLSLNWDKLLFTYLFFSRQLSSGCCAA